MNFFDNNNSNKDINNEKIISSNHNVILKPKELPEKNESSYTISILPNDNLIDFDEFPENDNDIFSNDSSEIYESSVDKINDLNFAKKLAFEKNLNDLKFIINNKKKRLSSNFISISNNSK